MKKNTIIAAAISGMLLGAAATAQAAGHIQSQERGSKMAAKRVADPPKKGKEKNSCKGKNECKGKGGCKTDKHACKGKNDCKGQGGCNGEAK